MSNRNGPHYAALGLPTSATNEEVRAAWKRLVLISHPDKIHPDPQALRHNGGDPELFFKVQSAYEAILGTATKEENGSVSEKGQDKKPSTNYSRDYFQRKPQIYNNHAQPTYSFAAHKFSRGQSTGYKKMYSNNRAPVSPQWRSDTNRTQSWRDPSDNPFFRSRKRKAPSSSRGFNPHTSNADEPPAQSTYQTTRKAPEPFLQTCTGLNDERPEAIVEEPPTSSKEESSTGGSRSTVDQYKTSTLESARVPDDLNSEIEKKSCKRDSRSPIIQGIATQDGQTSPTREIPFQCTTSNKTPSVPFRTSPTSFPPSLSDGLYTVEQWNESFKELCLEKLRNSNDTLPRLEPLLAEYSEPLEKPAMPDNASTPTGGSRNRGSRYQAFFVDASDCNDERVNMDTPTTEQTMRTHNLSTTSPEEKRTANCTSAPSVNRHKCDITANPEPLRLANTNSQGLLDPESDVPFQFQPLRPYPTSPGISQQLESLSEPHVALASAEVNQINVDTFSQKRRHIVQMSRECERRLIDLLKECIPEESNCLLHIEKVYIILGNRQGTVKTDINVIHQCEEKLQDDKAVDT